MERETVLSQLKPSSNVNNIDIYVCFLLTLRIPYKQIPATKISKTTKLKTNETLHSEWIAIFREHSQIMHNCVRLCLTPTPSNPTPMNSVRPAVSWPPFAKLKHKQQLFISNNFGFDNFKLLKCFNWAQHHHIAINSKTQNIKAIPPDAHKYSTENFEKKQVFQKKGGSTQIYTSPCISS